MINANFFFFDLFKYNSYFFSYYFSKILLVLNVYFIIFFLLLTAVFYYFSNYQSFFFFDKTFFFKKFLKFSLFSQLLVSFFLFFFSFYFYLNYIYTSYNNYINDTFFFFPKYFNYFSFNFFFFDNWISFYLSIDFFGYSLLFLSYCVGLMSLFVLDNRIYWKNIKYFFAFNIFVLIVYFYVSVSNLFLFFFFYEALLIPSFLFVYFISPSKRAIQASIYFVIWTQIGSVFVLLAFSYFIFFLNVNDFFSLKNQVFSYYEAFFIYSLLFFGFGFKVPIWPFHYWLTKTHVEAPSGFSIYLSGFLVKSALFGFYKITTSMLLNVDTLFFFIFCFFSVFDSSLKMWGQTDLKKIAAYGTIQEMNLIYMGLVLGDVFSLFFVVLFVLTHAFLSAFMFFLVDCVYRRFHTRSVVSINGILSICPNLAISIVAMLLCFSGLPGTVKFTVEFFLFGGLIEYSVFFSFFLIAIANIFGLIGFSKSWFNSLFGVKVKKVKYAVLDLTIKEILFISILVFFLFYFSFFFNYFLI